MGTPLPKSVHAKYRNLTTSDFAKLVMQVVKKPGASPDQQLIEWIVALAVRDLRQVFVTETMRDDLQAQKWLVFSIRYLKPLLLKDHKAATRKQVLKDIDNASDPERTAILWGDYEQYCAALKGELDKNTSALRKLSQLQENLLRAIPYMLNYEETVVNERCEQPLIHLEALVQENSPDAFSQVRSMMLNSIIPLRTTQRTALAAFMPEFQKYMDLAADASDTAILIFAGSSYHEYVGRVNEEHILRNLPRWADWGFLLSLLTLFIDWRSALPGIVLFFCIFFTIRIAISINLLNHYTWCRSRLNALKVVLAPREEEPVTVATHIKPNSQAVAPDSNAPYHHESGQYRSISE